MLNKSEYFEPIDPDEKNDEFIAIESKSFFKDVCERFVKNKRAMIALVIFFNNCTYGNIRTDDFPIFI